LRKVCWAAKLTVLGVLLGCADVPEPPAPPHAILLITLDTTRADHLSAYGYERPTTPTLDRLSAEGVRFDMAVSPMPTTDPSHLSMFTGLYPRTHGVRKNGVRLRDPDRGNLATWASSLGYRTGAFVSRKHLMPRGLWLKGFEAQSGPGQPRRDGAETLDRALAWIERDPATPFFVWLHLFDPHAPYQPPAPYDAMHAPDNVPRSELEYRKGNGHPRGEFFTDEEADALVALYDGEITYADGLVEKYLDAVSSLLPEGEEPLVIVMSDHGEALTELERRLGYTFDHGKVLYRNALRVPWIVHWKGHIAEGQVVEGPVQLLDLAPTLFELLGEEGFPSQGRSRASDLLGSGESVKELAFSERRHFSGKGPAIFGSREQFSVMDERYHLILSEPGHRTELYDMIADPAETEDLSEQLPDERRRLLRAFEQWHEESSIGVDQELVVPAEKVDALRALGYVE
jgi:arylsulfatase A-like enzyme